MITLHDQWQVYHLKMIGYSCGIEHRHDDIFILEIQQSHETMVIQQNLKKHYLN